MNNSINHKNRTLGLNDRSKGEKTREKHPKQKGIKVFGL